MTTPQATPTAQPRTIAWLVGAIAVACPLWVIHVWQARIMPPIATAAASLQSWMVLVPLLGSMLAGGWVLAAALGVQHRRDPRHLCWAPAATVAWGAAVATGSAFRAQGWLGSSLARLFAGHSAGWVAAVMAPVTEEPAKALVIVLIMAVIPRTRTLIWGLILGLCTGLGFQLVEDGVYALRSALAHPASDVAGATSNAMARMFTSVWSHWLFSTSMGVCYRSAVRAQSACCPEAHRPGAPLCVGPSLLPDPRQPGRPAPLSSACWRRRPVVSAAISPMAYGTW